MGSHPKLQHFVPEPPDEPLACRVPGSPLSIRFNPKSAAGRFDPAILPTTLESLRPP